MGVSPPADALGLLGLARRAGAVTPGVGATRRALGAGADDEQLEGTAVEQAVNYHIDFVKAPPGNGAALHSHGSEETFVALTGRWEIYWGDDGGDSVVLEPFDGIVVPDGVLRGFRNVSETEALLLTILGAHNAGHCVWAEALRPAFAAAAESRVPPP